MTAPFDRAEYAVRLRRTRVAMRDAGLDALLVFHQEHMFYLAGYDQIGYWVYQVLIVPAADEPMTAVVRKVDELLVRDGGIVDDIRVWLDDTTRDPAQQTADVLAERGLLRGKRLGIERKSHALLPYYYDLLRAALAGAELVDASDLVTELRVVKSPAEIAYMRRAGEVMDAGVRAAWETLRPGVRECDVHAAVAAAMYGAGGEHPSVAPPMGTGPRTLTQTHGAATTREVHAGDAFLLEVGGCVRRYHAVCMRTASVGPPGDRTRSMHDAIRAATDAGLAAIRAGVPTPDVARIVHDTLARHGYSRRGQHVGYGIGLGYPPTWIDSLRIKETDPHILREGMTFLFHAGLLAPEGDVYVALGDPVLVTAAGHERLTRLSRELTVLPVTFDLVLAGGTVVDGTGAAPFRADVGVTGERIGAVGQLDGAEGARVIDATGLVVAPGFIDPHTHAEGALLTDPQHAMGLRQGITTELLGIDGMSYAPLSAPNYRLYRRWLAGLLGEPPEDLDMSSVAAFRHHYHRRTAVNTAYLVPFATVRLEVLGFRDAPLRGRELDAARRLVESGLAQGAVGFSTGSKYYPGPWGDTEELVALCEPVRAAGAVYMCEPRTANLDRAHGGSGVAEALEVARRTGVRLHFAHYRTAPETAGRLDLLMRLIDPARADGLDVSFDVYPYPSGSSIPVSYLPGWAQEGGPDVILRRLTDPDDRRRIAQAIDEDPSIPLAHLVCSYAGTDRTLEGMSLADLTARRGGTPGQVLCDLLLSERLALGHVTAPPRSVALWRQVGRDCMALLARPDYMVCSDITPAGRFPHPRSYGAFPRVLGRLRREVGGLSLEAVVHRMTDRPARRFGLSGRGRVQRGYFADLAVFDPDRVIDTATYDDPCQFPIGIPFVVVNGQVAVDRERPTGVLAGHAVP